MSVHKLGCQLHVATYSLQSDSQQTCQQIPYLTVERNLKVHCYVHVPTDTIHNHLNQVRNTITLISSDPL